MTFSYRKTRQTWTIFVAVISLFLFGACEKKNGPSAGSPQSAPAGTIPSNTPEAPGPKDKGASSGGGGYVTKNSKRLLSLVIDEVAEEIKNASPFLFSDLPKGWDQKKFYSVLKNIRMNSTKNVERDNSDLLFNYGVDEKGPYIEALRPFFHVYGSIPLEFVGVYGHDMAGKKDASDSLKAIILDLKLKILHEVAHLFDKDEKQAEEYSLELLRRLEEDFYLCMVPKEEIVKQPNLFWVSPTEMSWWTVGGGGSSNCFGPKPGCELRYGFNWIYSNNWLYHQAKNKMIRSQEMVTYFSYLDTQPLERLLEAWKKEKAAPGVRWEKKFAGATGLPSETSENGTSIKYLDAVLVNEEPPVEKAVILNAKFEQQPTGPMTLTSARVTIPLMTITTEAPPDYKSMYGNPVAPLGRVLDESVDFELKCKYFGSK